MSATSVEQVITFRSMATSVTLQVLEPDNGAGPALDRAKAVFARVNRACTRFDSTSPLMLANAEPTRWHDVPAECAWAVEEASRAYQETTGVFDPRVLDALVDLGYDRTLPFADADVRLGMAHGDANRAQTRLQREEGRSRPWQPRVEHAGDRHRVHLDGARIDLGGIGKGLAVRWAARELLGAGSGVLVEAGGDCQLVGGGPSGDGWLVGMEDPHGGSDPLVVFSLRDLGCATSSARVRRWVVDGREVHHIIDPRTGLSGGRGLLSVTVINPDAAWAEVWSKTLFLMGIDQIEDVAGDRKLAAAWVDVDGNVRVNPAARDFVVWEAAHV